jgi:N-acetylglucosaminyl-diphospho-decaprenol L-rhamnosyltransferase
MYDINIVTVNYLMKDDILELLSSLFRDAQDSKYKVKITVVDNSQNRDKIKGELSRRFPEVNYIDPNSNLGFGKANNLGFRSQEARYYFAINPDTYIEKNQNFIENLINFMDNNPKVGCIGPKVLHFDGRLQYTSYNFDLMSILVKPLRQLKLDKKFKRVKKQVDHLEMRDFDHNSTRAVDWVLGAAMIVRKEVTDQIGFFDDRFFMYFEDSDWCRRMWEAGWPVYYVHDIVIKHKHDRGSSKVPGVFTALIKNKLARMHLASWVKYLWKWRGNNKYYEKL